MSKATEKYRIRRERLRELIDLGMDYGEIAKDEGKSESTIYNEIRECGLRRR